ncbi:MAG: RagB/SusD family nutrient uptake outer membrane protein, partial [Tannerella sp.]|nr:RagB/SusD family nutrient uptake outer membrane protein [Tannerella sp.]
MKRIYFILAAGLCLGLFSCNITDLSPKDSLTDESYWTKTEDLKLYANRLYTNLPSPAHLDNVSDNFITANYSSLLFNESNAPTGANDDNDIWSWRQIRRCNYFLTRYQRVPGTEAEINQYVGEVRFFRAYDYFLKVRKYGDVPYFEKDLQTDDADLLYKARDSRDLVVGKIIEDLEYAAQWLPEPALAEAGRVNRYAALAQLARVCLYEGTWKKYHNAPAGSLSSEQLLRKAAETAEAIINSGRYGIVRAGNDGGLQSVDGYPLYYSNLFIQESLTNNPECILPRIYIADVFQHGLSRSTGENGTGYSKDFVESFLCRDGKPIGSSPLYQGDETWETELTNRDPRMYQLIDNLNKPWSILSGQVQFHSYTNVTPSGAVTGYPSVKFHSPLQEQNEADKSTYDWFIYRYAEALLIYAEAKAELGECT